MRSYIPNSLICLAPELPLKITEVIQRCSFAWIPLDFFRQVRDKILLGLRGVYFVAVFYHLHQEDMFPQSNKERVQINVYAGKILDGARVGYIGKRKILRIYPDHMLGKTSFKMLQDC